MLFRYKVKTCTYCNIDLMFHGPGIGYEAIVQYYKPDAKLFKWRHFNVNKMCYILNKIGHLTDDIDNNDKLLRVLQQYNGIEEIMFKYIKKIMEDEDYERRKNDMLNNIDDIVLTGDWNTIEIKENA